MAKTILFQGDSITDFGRSREPQSMTNEGLGTGYPMLVAARINADAPGAGYTVINRGISGNRVVDLYARWKIDALNLKPDVISILIGVNDTCHEFGAHNGVEPERYAKVYRELLAWTKSALPDCKIVLCEPFVSVFSAVTEEWLPEINERRRIVKELADEFGALFIPFQSILDEAIAKSSPELILMDGVHPRLAGHQVMADAWVKAVREAGWL